MDALIPIAQSPITSFDFGSECPFSSLPLELLLKIFQMSYKMDPETKHELVCKNIRMIMKEVKNPGIALKADFPLYQSFKRNLCISHEIDKYIADSSAEFRLAGLIKLGLAQLNDTHTAIRAQTLRLVKKGNVNTNDIEELFTSWVTILDSPEAFRFVNKAFVAATMQGFRIELTKKFPLLFRYRPMNSVLNIFSDKISKINLSPINPDKVPYCLVKVGIIFCATFTLAHYKRQIQKQTANLNPSSS